MNIRQVRQKIRSVSNVKKITQAMELVSAIKMRKAQTTALEGKPYQDFLEKSIKKFIRKVDPRLSLLLSIPQTSSMRKLIIFITSNKGLCGAFNINLTRFLGRSVNLMEADFITIGRKGAQILNQLKAKILADFSSSPQQENVSAAFNLALSEFLGGAYSEVLVFYNKFISSLRYLPTEEKLLPITLEVEQEIEMPKEDYLVEPSPEEVVDPLLRNFIEEKIRFALIESEAGEHSARMIAMKNATDNAADVVNNLTLLRNELRQQKITYELLDMLTARESVEYV